MDRRKFLKSAVLLGGGFLAGRAGCVWESAPAGETAKESRGGGKTHGIFFSATGTTKRIVGEVAGRLQVGAAMHDISRRPFVSGFPLAADDVAVVGVPVYSGRVPPLAVKSLRNLRGADSRTIAIVVYGNRDYDDALLELKDVLEESGCVVVAGAAFVGQHSIFPKVAEGRPDSVDIDAAAEFAAQCGEKLAAPEMTEIDVKGARPYREPPPVPLKPVIDSSCTGCGACVVACPAKALKLNRANRTIARRDEACISCAACIHVCPVGAQAFRGEQYEKVEKMFAERASVRRDPEYFL